MQFGTPIWLAGVGGILIPLAIHLLSRKEGKVIRIGSIRHFEETSTRQFKSIKLNEILLLILRSILILLIVFFLAELQWPGKPDGKTNWVLIEKGLDRDPELSRLIDSLSEKGFAKRAFAKDFPTIADTISSAPQNYWDLIESISKEQLDSVVIISANRSNAFRGGPKALPANVSWISKPLAQNESVISELKVSTDSVLIRTGSFSELETEFTNRLIASTSSAKSADTVNVTIVSEKQYAYDAKLIHASLTAINRYTPHVVSVSNIETSSFTADKTEWTIWLSSEQIPAHEKKLIAVSAQPSQNILERASQNTWFITRRLTPENIIEENLTTQLTELLFPATESWSKANELDVRANDDQLVGMHTGSSGHMQATSYSGQTLWIVLIALTFIGERIVSYQRMQ
jgi:hypothetical protein